MVRELRVDEQAAVNFLMPVLQVVFHKKGVQQKKLGPFFYCERVIQKISKEQFFVNLYWILLSARDLEAPIIILSVLPAEEL